MRLSAGWIVAQLERPSFGQRPSPSQTASHPKNEFIEMFCRLDSLRVLSQTFFVWKIQPFCGSQSQESLVFRMYMGAVPLPLSFVYSQSIHFCL